MTTSSVRYDLVVEVLTANNLKNTQAFGTQDPYVKLLCGGKKFKTQVCEDGGSTGVFNRTFTFNAIELGPLEVQVKNKNVTDRYF